MLNQTQFGAPGGSGVDISPVTSAMNEFFNKRKNKGKELERMAGQYALDTMRDSRKHGQTMELEGMRQSHQASMQTRGLEATATEGKAKRRQETRMTKLQQQGGLDMKRLDIAGNILQQERTFAGVSQLGKEKRVSTFKATKDGGVDVAYNKPQRRRRSSVTPGQPTQVAPAATPRSTATPVVPTGTTTVAPVMRDSKTGRAVRNPAYTSSTSTTKTKPSPNSSPKQRRKPA